MALLVWVLWLNACVSKMEKPIASVSGIQAEEAVFLEYKNEGDREFNKMFWQGWQNAIDCYERALEIKNEPGLTGRLFEVYLLIAFRELYLQVPLANREQKLANLSNQIPGSEYGVFVKIIGSLGMKKAFLIGGEYLGYYDPEVEKKPVAKRDDVDYRYYLYILWLGFSRQYTLQSQAKQAFDERFPESNLFLSSAQDISLPLIDRKLGEYPDFAELFLARGNLYKEKRKYLAAIRDYQSAFKIMPQLFRAYNEIAGIYVFIQDYRQAIGFYDRTLEVSAYEPVALFGKAVSLSHLGQIDESNSLLRLLLEKQALNHGEAYYYLAKNHYNQQKLAGALEYIDLARSYLPYSAEVNMLSGLVHLAKQDHDGARADFLRVIDAEESSGDAHYHLGQIAWLRGEKEKAREYYRQAVECFWQENQGFDGKLTELNDTELSETDRDRAILKIKRLQAIFLQDAMKKTAPVLRIWQHRQGISRLIDIQAKLKEKYRETITVHLE